MVISSLPYTVNLYDFKEHANLIVTTAWVNNTESVILYGFHQNKRSKDNDGNSNDDDDTTDDDDDYDDRTMIMMGTVDCKQCPRRKK